MKKVPARNSSADIFSARNVLDDGHKKNCLLSLLKLGQINHTLQSISFFPSAELPGAEMLHKNDNSVMCASQNHKK